MGDGNGLKDQLYPAVCPECLKPQMKVREHIDAVLSACGRPGKRGGRGAVPETCSFRGAFFQISQYAVRGQKQRIVIALAMLKKPELLFMDEPSSAIDFITLRRILEYIWSIKGTTTILMTAHQRPFLEKAVDRIVELSEGEKCWKSEM